MAENEIEYLHRRATEELDYADRCTDMIAAQIHRQLAGLYANKLSELRNLASPEIAEFAPPEIIKLVPLEIVERIATP